MFHFSICHMKTKHFFFVFFFITDLSSKYRARSYKFEQHKNSTIINIPVNNGWRYYFLKKGEKRFYRCKYMKRSFSVDFLNVINKRGEEYSKVVESLFSI